MEYNDETILTLLATDLNQHYGLLWQKYADNIYAYILRRTRNPHDTEDIMQNIALRIYNALRDYSQEKIRSMVAWLRPWLYKVATSAYLTYIEEQKKRLVPISLDLEDDPFAGEIEDVNSKQPAEILESKEQRHELEGLVADLPPKYRDVIYLHYFDGWKLHEVAELLQEQAGTIRQRERRALSLLRKAMQKDGIH
jgi:RNA polymerase sigma-70 factor, ECF subfamily